MGPEPNLVKYNIVIIYTEYQEVNKMKFVVSQNKP